jgi:hypothetical protein
VNHLKMKKENDNTKITASELEFLEKELTQTNEALTLEKLTEKLAFKKTSSQLEQKVKKYDPFCKYEVGDLIYKEYDEPLLTSSKGADHFKGSVVFRVQNKIAYQNFESEMLEVEYSGGGPFRKHVDYMKKTKTQVLLPSNCESKGLTPEVLKKEEDPRLDHVPMTDKDLKGLERNLGRALSKSDIFFHWNDFWQLKQKQVKIPKNKIEEIKKHFRETKQSSSTTELCTQFFKQNPDNDLFGLYCLSLNHAFEKTYKKDFVFVAPTSWGRWHLKEILDGFLKGLPLSASHAKLPALEKEETTEPAKPAKFPLKIYLTWREILSGGVKIPKSLRKAVSTFREYAFINSEEEKSYTVYFYPSQGIFLGLKEFYETNNVPQGASLTLEKQESGIFNFWLKRSKKKLSVPEVTYDPKKDIFSDTGEEQFTFSLPNKIIHLERDTLTKLFSLYKQREKRDLKELLILIFNHFGLEGEHLFLHYLRAFHLVDMLKQTTQEDIEKVLVRSSEFEKSEKKKGIFFYAEEAKAVPEPEGEARAAQQKEIRASEKGEEVKGEAQLAIGTIEDEVPTPEVEEEVIVVEEVAEKEVQEIKPPEPLEPSELEVEAKPKKEPPLKKKKKKAREIVEREVVPRRRKGEKKFIEEQIELEESELEALFAVKSKRELEKEKVTAEEKKEKEEYEVPTAETSKFGVFAEKLKSALGQQKEEDKKLKTKKKKKKK